MEEDGALITDIIGTIVNWTETTRVDGNKLTTNYAWVNADGTAGKCAQHFERAAA